ncbi:hypothetical protein [Flavobacterium facile]|uniref:hypothetical protein n=1 Tax=Flavobacterium facile TaxID=2893174 RepID=UPI002E75C285|nr:hypothetical protein [Flavobacterium sp. T-12]
MRPELIKTDNAREFYKTTEELTDRELQEKQTFYLWEINQNTKKTKENLQFFFYFTIVALLASLVIFR